MIQIRQCARCGHDLTDPAASRCPVCGTQFARRPGGRIWITALVQFSLATAFLLLSHFPKWTIFFFGIMILIGTLVASRATVTAAKNRPTPHAPITRPVLLKIVSLLIAIFGFGFLSSLLFGFVIFINNWNDWHRYEGQPYHRSTFEVRQVYYQRTGRGGVDTYARGNVEGQREWMSLRPYIGPRLPRDQAELDQRVPVGTEIPVYFFPDMKGRSRIRVYGETPPAEDYHRTAMNALNYGLMGLAICAIAIFVLTRLRATCFATIDAAQQPALP